ncbi:hypothetical protein [Xylella fastidiosa]|uniref:hypothetical protein n=1 Tax=Xylella fastidiosa TaxID=2371 RepID=UPI000AD3ED9D|nr:hypothetical protein [Xylella fastidiosa]
MPSDRLKAFEFKSAFLYKSSQAQIALINANKEISLNKWNVALNTITLINTKNLPYPIFGIGRNSNGDNGQRKLVVDRQLVVPVLQQASAKYTWTHLEIVAVQTPNTAITFT